MSVEMSPEETAAAEVLMTTVKRWSMTNPHAAAAWARCKNPEEDISTTFCILLEGLLEENERLTRMLEQELWRQPMVIHVKPERFEELLQQARPEADK